MRTPLIAANWKMNNTVSESLKFVAATMLELKTLRQVDVVIAPPYTALYSMNVALAETEISLGAQNMHWEESGAYTGEISASFLKDVGCKYIIIGHSERRQYFNETDETVNLRIQTALRHDLIPIVCVGETLEERESDRTWEVIERQLTGGLRDIAINDYTKFVIAYEPVWAIGTGKTATPEQAQEIHSQIRGYLESKYGREASSAMRLLYGGSVKGANSAELMSKEDIDGALVGGASLDAKQFAEIVRNSQR